MTGENDGWPVAGVGHNSEPAGVIIEQPTYEKVYPSQPSHEEPEAFRVRRNAEIQHWQAAKPILDQAKANEADLRAKVTATLFPTPVKGTQRYDLGGGYKVKLVHGLTYTLGDKDKVDEVEGKKIPIRVQIEELEAAIIAKHGGLGDQVLKRLITWKPELSGSEYEKLDPHDELELDIRNMIDEHLTIKPASPQLTFEEPKEKA